MVTIDRKQVGKPVAKREDLNIALRTISGEKAPRIEVKKDGKNLTYQDLEKMTVAELAGCDILLLGKALRYHDPDCRERDKENKFRKESNFPLKPVTFHASWDGFGGTSAGSFRADKPAIEALETMYDLPLAFISGGV